MRGGALGSPGPVVRKSTEESRETSPAANCLELCAGVRPAATCSSSRINTGMVLMPSESWPLSPRDRGESTNPSPIPAR